MEAGQASLRTALSSLRRQLEPPGVPPGSVLVADRSQVRLNPAAAVTDTGEFEAALRSAARLTQPADRAPLLSRAVESTTPRCFPGFSKNGWRRSGSASKQRSSAPCGNWWRYWSGATVGRRASAAPSTVPSAPSASLRCGKSLTST